MKFDALDKQLRIYETNADQKVLPGLWMVARLDGRGFTRLTKDVLNLERPFDPRFRDAMLDTVEHLMKTGFRVLYGYTQSDEISLLLHKDDDTFHRKLRKLNSVLAGEASAYFSLALEAHACFDCRISQLPTEELVVDYFRWRQEDARRNSLNAHCYWKLREEGLSAKETTRQLSGLRVSDKNELLFQKGINFNDLPSWQKRGSGLYWETWLKPGQNPVTGESVKTERHLITRDLDLPLKEEYSDLIRSLMNPSHPK